MPNPENTTEQASETQEYEQVQKELQTYEKRYYSQDFLAHYKAENPDAYADLKDLLEAEQDSDDLDKALGKLNDTLDQRDLSQFAGRFDFGPNGNMNYSVEKGRKVISYYNGKVGEPSQISLVNTGDKMEGPWVVKHSSPAVVYSDLEDASEDVALLSTALARVQEGDFVASYTDRDPFVMSGNRLGFRLQDGGIAIVDGADWVDAQSADTFITLANARYRQLEGMETAPKAVTPGLADLKASDEKQIQNHDAMVSTMKETFDPAMKDLNDWEAKNPESDANYRDQLDQAYAAFSKASAVYNEAAMTAALGDFQRIASTIHAELYPEPVVEASTADSTGTSRGSTPEARAESTPKEAEPQSEAEFLAKLHKTENAGKYTTETTDANGDRTVIVHLPTKGDVRWSRIHDFEGKDGVALNGLSDVTQFTLKSKGTDYRWGKDSNGTDTWVDAGGKRLLVVDGTTYVVHKNEPEAVAAAPKAEPAPLAEAPKPTETLATFDPEQALDPDEAAILVAKAKGLSTDSARIDAERTRLSTLAADSRLSTDERARYSAQLKLADQRLEETYTALEGALTSIDKGMPADQALAAKEANGLDDALSSARAFAKRETAPDATQTAAGDAPTTPVATVQGSRGVETVTDKQTAA